MCLPDQSHIDQVRDALWKRPDGASVMVGAGLSRNASSLIPSTDILPTLDDLTESLFKDLYPQREHNNCGNVTHQSIEPNNFPRLAQEYEAAFGRGRLNQFLQDRIRDNQFGPTDVHKRLLRLPWRDVFTTNWDTLLEKSLTSVPERKYSILRNKDEIPLAARPRIVKLHGSFPAHFPLICTQEDYRTYPVKFAPFVNTVRQAMMETVFLLIGFSGDDSNFIHWTGWARDNLGESAPKIYLAGWLGLSYHRRRMLEHRNVVAIDLARHPKADQWPEHQRHKYATKWILYVLERGKPYMITKWPLPQTRRYLGMDVPDALQPVGEIKTDEPQKEPWPSDKSGPEGLSAQVDRIIWIWTHNRNLYPGWLAVPISVRRAISLNTDDWEPIILKVLPELDLVQQLNVIYELIWRREILLDPLLSELELAAQDVLRQINCQNRTISGAPKTGIEWSDVRRDYRNVMLALVTNARLRFDHETFKERLEALEDFQDDAPDVAQRIHHERCLWAIYSLDYKSLSDLLSNWSPEDCDPFWMVRKATLLYEMNRIDDAFELSRKAFSAIREIPDNIRSVVGPSREGWALWQVAVIESAISWMRFGQSDQDKAEFSPDRFNKRWRELAPMKCDTSSEIREYGNVLTPENKREVVSVFDLGRRTIPGMQFSNAGQYRQQAAYRVIRLSEVAGLPTFSFGTLKTAAEELSVSDTEVAVRLILRTLSYDKDDLFERILSRARVTLMPVELARKLTRICNSVIEYALPRIGVADAGGRRRFWTERMRVAMEVRSRLVVLLDPEDMEEVLSSALRAYQNETIIREQWLHQPLCNTLRRSWLALPIQRRAERVLDLLAAPIFGVDNAVRPLFLYPDPNELLQEQLPPPDRTNDNESRWQQIVSQLVRGLNEGGEARKRSSLWVHHIASWNRLTEEETIKVMQALWNEKFTESTGLPKETSLFEWAFMVLPEPGLAKQRFHNRYLSDRESVKENEGKLRKTLDQVGKAFSGMKTRGKSLALSETEEQFLIDILWQWSNAPMPASKNSSAFVSLHSVDQFVITEINGISAILAEVKIPVDLAEKLHQKMKGLSDLGFSAFGFIPGLSTVLENHFDELSQAMRLRLISQDKDLAEAALEALFKWLLLAVEPASRIQPPPDDLVREIGVMIATPRKETLGFALQVAKWIFDKGSGTQKESIRDMALEGLTYLLEELKYDRENVEGNNDLPDLRNYTVQLALSMYRHGLQNNHTIDSWLQAAKDDPLPELRYAIDSA